MTWDKKESWRLFYNNLEVDFLWWNHKPIEGASTRLNKKKKNGFITIQFIMCNIVQTDMVLCEITDVVCDYSCSMNIKWTPSEMWQWLLSTTCP